MTFWKQLRNKAVKTLVKVYTTTKPANITGKVFFYVLGLESLENIKAGFRVFPIAWRLHPISYAYGSYFILYWYNSFPISKWRIITMTSKWARWRLKSPDLRVFSGIYSVADHRKHQSSVPLAFVKGIHRWPVNSPHKGPVTRKMFPFDDVIMIHQHCCNGVMTIMQLGNYVSRQNVSTYINWLALAI